MDSPGYIAHMATIYIRLLDINYLMTGVEYPVIGEVLVIVSHDLTLDIYSLVQCYIVHTLLSFLAYWLICKEYDQMGSMVLRHLHCTTRGRIFDTTDPSVLLAMQV